MRVPGLFRTRSSWTARWKDLKKTVTSSFSDTEDGSLGVSCDPDESFLYEQIGRVNVEIK